MGLRPVQIQDPGVQDESLVQGRPQGTVEAILQIEVALPVDHVRKEVTVEGRIPGQQCVQVEDALRRDQLVQTYLPGRYPGPFPLT